MATKKQLKPKPSKKIVKKPGHKITNNDIKHIAPYVVKLLKTAKGKKKAVNCSYIRRFVYSQSGIKIDGAKTRVILHYIRTKGLVNCVIADNSGYYITSNTSDITTYLKVLQQRIKQIGQLKAAIKKQAAIVIGRQKQIKKHGK